MRTRVRLAGIGIATLAATALFAGPAFASSGRAVHLSGAAVFVQTDDTAGNSVVVYDSSGGGTLTRAGTFATGGVGGVLGGSVVDHLGSQGSLTYDRAAGLLYAVNAGSNTVTVFTVHGDRLSRNQVISSGGAFPVSVAVHGALVYVLNARDGGSIQGYVRVGATLVRVPSWHRALGLDPTQTPEFTSTPGQVAFSPGGSQLLVTTKNGANSVEVFSVGLFGLSAKPVVNSLPGDVPFAVAFDSRGHLLLGEAGPNAVGTFTLNGDGTVSALGQVATGGSATCWVTVAGETVFASNAGSNDLSGFVDGASGALTSLGDTTTDAGSVDTVVSSNGRYLYAQTGGNGIVDEFAIGTGGSLTEIGSVTVPGAVGGEGIAAG
jgi:6-phosphogluconolactonase (cycloisomerase 2 family)